MTQNEKIMLSMIVSLVVSITLLALTSSVDSMKALMQDYYIAKCEKQHEKPCEIVARVVE